MATENKKSRLKVSDLKPLMDRLVAEQPQNDNELRLLREAFGIAANAVIAFPRPKLIKQLKRGFNAENNDIRNLTASKLYEISWRHPKQAMEVATMLFNAATAKKISSSFFANIAQIGEKTKKVGDVFLPVFVKLLLTEKDDAAQKRLLTGLHVLSKGNDKNAELAGKAMIAFANDAENTNAARGLAVSLLDSIGKTHWDTFGPEIKSYVFKLAALESAGELKNKMLIAAQNLGEYIDQKEKERAAIDPDIRARENRYSEIIELAKKINKIPKPDLN